MENNQSIITSSSENTQEYGVQFAKKILSSLTRRRFGMYQTVRPLANVVICLYGDLGSGKTTFTQGLAKGLGIKKRIISPTFVIVRSYEVKSQKSKVKTTTQNSKFFYHIDLYRIATEEDLKTIGIEEILNDPHAIVAIEWAEKLGSLLPKKRWDIRFEYVDEEKRRITIKKFEARNPKHETNSNVQN